MATEIFGSKEKTFASEQTQSSTRGYGQNGSAVSPVQPIGAAKKISKTYASLATPDVNISATANEGFQTRTVSSKPYPTTPSMRNPNASPAKVPLSNVRRANNGIILPTRR
jgi:hypothetical protein